MPTARSYVLADRLLLLPALGAAFHGVIWYTLGVNYLTSVIIQWTLVLDADDWERLEALPIVGVKHERPLDDDRREIVDSERVPDHAVKGRAERGQEQQAVCENI